MVSLKYLAFPSVMSFWKLFLKRPTCDCAMLDNESWVEVVISSPSGELSRGVLQRVSGCPSVQHEPLTPAGSQDLCHIKLWSGLCLPSSWWISGGRLLWGWSVLLCHPYWACSAHGAAPKLGPLGYSKQMISLNLKKTIWCYQHSSLRLKPFLLRMVEKVLSKCSMLLSCLSYQWAGLSSSSANVNATKANASKYISNFKCCCQRCLLLA